MTAPLFILLYAVNDLKILKRFKVRVEKPSLDPVMDTFSGHHAPSLTQAVESRGANI